MGLAVSVGVLASDSEPESTQWLRKQFRQVNRLLAAKGLPPHEEPEDLPKIPYRGQLMGFPYSWLHYLRRAVAFARQAPEEFCPTPQDWDPGTDERMDRELSVSMDSHLICHSDCEGFYVPTDFPEPLYSTKEIKIQGAILGSSQRTLQEVRQAAPLLGIRLVKGNLSDAAARKIAEEEDGAHPYWIERKVWLTMFEAFRLSVEYKSAVVFG